MTKTGAAILLLMSLGGTATAQPISAAVQARLSKLLPEGTAEPARFYAWNLYEYIDGAAEAFHAYDMAAMVHRDYKVKGTDLTVDIYDMGDPLNAFGIYAAERAPDYHFIPIGAEGYSSEQTLNFLQGACYVKLAAFGGNTVALLDAFAKDISGRIGGAKSMPAVLAFFPTRNLVARSEKYVRKAPLGHDFLAPAIMATYKSGGKESTLIISLAKTAREAQQRVAKLNSSEGVFLARGRYTILLVDPPPDAARLIKECIAKIPEK